MSAIYNQANFQNAILTLLACVVLIIIVWCFYTFIRAIILFVFSGNKEDNKKKGRNSIRFMIIGIILSLLLLFMVPTVLRAMNVPSYESYSAKHVFVRAWDVINYILKLGNVIKKSQENNQILWNPYYNPDSTPAVQDPSANGYQL
jgi:formate hydrogenlyase subunit 3/multisubunit Na+/H+ antiporter MnhD subunit